MRSQRRDCPPPPSLSLDRRMSKLAEKGDGERKHKSPRGKTYYARALRKISSFKVAPFVIDLLRLSLRAARTLSMQHPLVRVPTTDEHEKLKTRHKHLSACLGYSSSLLRPHTHNKQLEV